MTENKHELSPTIWKLVTMHQRGKETQLWARPTARPPNIAVQTRTLQKQKARRSLLRPRPGYPGRRAVFVSCQCLKSGALAPGRGSREGSRGVQGRTISLVSRPLTRRPGCPAGPDRPLGRARRGAGGRWVSPGQPVTESCPHEPRATREMLVVVEGAGPDTGHKAHLDDGDRQGESLRRGVAPTPQQTRTQQRLGK